jgi:hypothetical protein
VNEIGVDMSATVMINIDVATHCPGALTALKFDCWLWCRQ